MQDATNPGCSRIESHPDRHQPFFYLYTIQSVNVLFLKLMQYFQTQERVKLIEKYQKMQAKEREVKEHKFWNTQPVPQGEEDTSTVQAAINPEMTVAEVRQEPLNMVGGFEWCSVDLLDPAQVRILLRRVCFIIISVSFEPSFASLFYNFFLTPLSFRCFPAQ